GDHLRPRHELARLLDRELERLRVDGVRLRHRDDSLLDAEEPEDREVLVRLRPGALARVDHEQEQVDPRRPRDHRADEPLVPGHVDEREPPAVGELERRVSERDRDPAPALLRQPVGVLARQRLDEPRLAVVDVAGGADRQRHARTAAATSSASASVSVRQSRSVRPSRTIATTGGSPRRSGSASASSTAHAQLGTSASGSAPPPARATVASTSPPTAAASRSARARTAASGSRSMRTTGSSSGACSASNSVPSSAASVSLSARTARWSGWRRSFSTSSARPTTMPACGPPRSLSPEKHTRSAPAASTWRTSGSSHRSVSAPEPRSSTSGSPWRRAIAASSSTRGSSENPTTR